MACKATHHETGQQLRFANRAAAEGYTARYGGGSEHWDFTEIDDRGAGISQPQVRPSRGAASHPRG